MINKFKLSNKQPLRSEVNEKYTWNTKAIFSSEKEFEKEFIAVRDELDKICKFAGRLGEKSSVLNEFLTKLMRFKQRLDVLLIYVHLLKDQDTGNSFNQANFTKVNEFAANVNAALAFVKAELMAMDESKLSEFLAENKNLQLYKKWFDNIRRLKKHTLSENEEKLLAMLSPIMNTGSTVFAALNNADISFESFADANGNIHEVTHSSYGRLIESYDRSIRAGAFKSLHTSYKNDINTFAATLGSIVKLHNLDAKLRGFGSAREAAVFKNHIPEDVYINLLKTINDNLPLLHEYVSMRKNKLELSDMYPYDLYPKIIKDVDMSFTIEKAAEIICEALNPLGEIYTSRLKKAFTDKWIDWVDNKGKRSGAYSSGCYGTNPFILLSWQGTLSNLFTLAHELGHSMHSYLTWENQPYPYANYCIFLAEIASTTNENLLSNYLLKKFTKPEERAFIANHYLDRIKATMFRQSQFAEFEQEIHRADQNEIVLTADFLCKTYGDINQKYYGPSLNFDANITYEWARIPHFYYNFYVYQYATGFAAATAFATAILNEGDAAVKRYLGFLSSGSSKDPIETLQAAGVDMTTPKPIENTLKVFKEYMDKLK